MEHHDHGHQMQGARSPYPMAREASGTSWQPDAAPMDGIHAMRGDWSATLHGFADIVYDRQGGRRGNEKVIDAGAIGSAYRMPRALDAEYGADPLSFMLFLRTSLAS